MELNLKLIGMKRISLLLLLLFFGWTNTGSAQIHKETIHISTLSAAPAGWKQQGMWGFDKQMIMSPQKGRTTHLQRDLMGDGHIIAGFRITDENLSTITGVQFTFPDGRIGLERRISGSKPFAVMVLEQNGKVMGEQVLSIPAGDVELMLQRKGNKFSSWVAEPKKDFRQVAELEWPNISDTIQIAVYGRITEGIPVPVSINYLEAVGARPEKITLSRNSLRQKYESTASKQRVRSDTTAKTNIDPPTLAQPDKLRSSDGRYIDNLNGTITDTKTGLMWAKFDSSIDLGRPLSWNGSLQHVNTLDLGGYNDWRMPTLAELKSIYELDKEHVMQYDSNNIIAMDPIFVSGLYTFWAADKASCRKDLFFGNWFRKCCAHYLFMGGYSSGKVHDNFCADTNGKTVRAVRQTR
jgi:hypothetical protein